MSPDLDRQTAAAFALILHVLYGQPWLTAQGLTAVAWAIAAFLGAVVIASLYGDVRQLLEDT